LGTAPAFAADVCVSVVGSGVALREDPSIGDNIIDRFDQPTKFYLLLGPVKGWLKLQLTYDDDNADVVGWMSANYTRVTKCPKD
jgi:hypothetical protein